MADKPTYEELEQRIKKLEKETSKQNRVEWKLKWELAVNTSLSKLYKPLISRDSTIEDITNTILDEAMYLTGSKYGYVSSIDPNTGDNVGHTLTEMLGRQCNVTATQTRIAFPIGEDGLYGGLWGHALNTREALIANKPAEHPAAKGIPKGHIPVECFLTVPVTLDKQLVGQIALANKNEDYTEQDLNAIRRLAEYYALAIQRMRAEEEREKLINELQEALKEIKTLRGILPLCSFCNKIRDDKGYWERVDVYIHKYSEADISHSICPDCAKDHYPDLKLSDD